MAVSIEALAMAGNDYNEWGLDTKEWEDDDDSQFPPPHLLVDENEDEPAEVAKQITRIITTGSPTRRPKDVVEAGKHPRLFRNRTLPRKIKQSSKSIKMMIKYMSIMLLTIAMIVGRKRIVSHIEKTHFLNPSGKKSL